MSEFYPIDYIAETERISKAISSAIAISSAMEDARKEKMRQMGIFIKLGYVYSAVHPGETIFQIVEGWPGMNERVVFERTHVEKEIPNELKTKGEKRGIRTRPRTRKMGI